MEQAKYVPIKPQERDRVKSQVEARFGKAQPLSGNISYNILQIGINVGNYPTLLSATEFVCGITDNETAKSVALQLETISDYTENAKFIDACIDTLRKVDASYPSHLGICAKALVEFARRDKTYADPDTATKVKDMVLRNVNGRSALEALRS